jgi:RNA polymerase sigma-70 factor (ECF subfamily)
MTQQSNENTQTDRELITRLLRGEAGSWREFQVRFDRLVRRQVERVCRGFARALGSDEMEEIRAEFYLSLVDREMRKLRLFDPTRGLKLSSWVALLAGNAARDFLRAHRRRPATLSATGEVDRVDDRDLFEETANRERCARALDALRSFPAQDQRLLLMLHVEEASVDEIAGACGGSEKTVYTRAHRIRAQVRQRCNPAALAA